MGKPTLSLKLDGIEELNRQLKRVGSEARAELKAALDECGRIVKVDARRRVRVDSGDARDTIEYEVKEMRDGTLYAIITAGGGEQYYVSFLEFGTSKMAACPFMRPSIDENRQIIGEVVRGRLKAVIERMGVAHA